MYTHQCHRLVYSSICLISTDIDEIKKLFRLRLSHHLYNMTTRLFIDIQQRKQSKKHSFLHKPYTAVDSKLVISDLFIRKHHVEKVHNTWRNSHPWSLFMMTSSNGNIFRVTGPLCGEFTGPGEFPTQRPVTRSFDVYFDLRLNKRLCKQSWGWWFETLLCPLWRHSNG